MHSLFFVLMCVSVLFVPTTKKKFYCTSYLVEEFLDVILRFLLFQGVAMVCGFLVVIALGVAAFFAQRTRGKIWRYGKPNIHWEEPLVGVKASEGRDVEEWVRVNCVMNTV